VKKLILILLLFILPFQFSWAAAGSYCQHEQGAGAHHFGHHAHQHQINADTPQDKSEAGKMHADCNACHGAGCVVFIAAIPVLGILPAVREYVEPCPISYTSHIPDGPRRPDRLPVA
jgi:cytochrome c553